jgi:hypothetical protein
MREALRRRLMKLAEEVEGDKSEMYLEARKGKVPVSPPTSPDDEGDSETYPIDDLKKESAIRILKEELFKLAEESCPDCGEADCECDDDDDDDEMEKESAWMLRRSALDLIKSAMPGAPGAPPPAGPPPAGPAGPPMPPQAGPPMPPPGPGAPGIPPEVMMRLQQHVQDHMMMEQMGLEGGEASAPPPGPGPDAASPSMGVPPPQAAMGEGESPEGPEKQAALRILKDMIFGL